MGTRNLTAVVKDGKFKVAQYGQWDGYPSGQGVTVAKFITGRMKKAEFERAVEACRFLNPDEIKQKWIDAGAKPDDEWVGQDVANAFKRANPQLSRDAAADVLDMIQTDGVRELSDDSSFAADSLFCEWAYVLDLDNEMLEVYEGFNKAPVPEGERFADLPKAKDGGEYFPIKLLVKIPFNQVTIDWMEKLERSEDDETA